MIPDEPCPTCGDEFCEGCDDPIDCDDSSDDLERKEPPLWE